MKKHDDVIDLGAAQDETNGALRVVIPEVQPGDLLIVGVIRTEFLLGVWRAVRALHATAWSEPRL
jgi:hypothetical protein